MRNVLARYGFMLCTLVPCSGIANELEVFVTKLDGGSGLQYLDVWSGRFDDYSGTPWDVSSYYKPLNSVFYISGALTIVSKNWAISPTFYADSGYRSLLLNAEPMFNLGMSLSFNLSNKTTITFSDNAIFTQHGTVSEKPCYDSFDRSYHCGTGISWLDSLPYHLSRVLPHIYKLKLTTRF